MVDMKASAVILHATWFCSTSLGGKVSGVWKFVRFVYCFVKIISCDFQ